jgi:hypothetical protein
MDHDDHKTRQGLFDVPAALLKQYLPFLGCCGVVSSTLYVVSSLHF